MTRAIVGICHMQVCAVKDVTDEEILNFCNSRNPSGTMGGWSTVIRAAPEDSEMFGKGENLVPKQCSDDEGRLHILISC